MANLWNSPLYTLIAKNGKKVIIDVTSSVSAGLRPSKVIFQMIDFFKEKGVERIVDFGAGSLRHTFPLLKAGFIVCAVEFKEQFMEHTVFKITKRSLKNLKSEGMPDKALNSLEMIQNKEIAGKERFLSILKLMIGEKHTENYKLSILKHSTKFKISKDSRKELKKDGVPKNVLKKLGSVKNKVITGKQEFLNTLKRTIGEKQTIKYKSKIIKHSLQRESKRVCIEAYEKASKYPNFFTLTYPNDFVNDERKFDAALLCYVFQTMPEEKERKTVLNILYDKLEGDCYLLWMSRYEDLSKIPENQQLGDGHFKYPDRKYHSFNTQFKTDDIHNMMRKIKWPWKGYRRLRSMRIKGEDQTFIYTKWGTWP